MGCPDPPLPISPLPDNRLAVRADAGCASSPRVTGGDDIRGPAHYVWCSSATKRRAQLRRAMAPRADARRVTMLSSLTHFGEGTERRAPRRPSRCTAPEARRAQDGEMPYRAEPARLTSEAPYATRGEGGRYREGQYRGRLKARGSVFGHFDLTRPRSLGFSPNQINHSGRQSVYTDYLPVRAVDICVPGTPPGGRRATVPNAGGGGAPDYAPGYECAVWQSRRAGALAGSVPVACRPPRVPRDAVSPRCRGNFTETPPEGPNTRPGRRPDDKRWGNGGALPAYTHQGLSEAVSAAVHPPCEP